MGTVKNESKVMVSPRKAEAMKGVKGTQAKISGYRDGGCVHKPTGGSKRVGGK